MGEFMSNQPFRKIFQAGLVVALLLATTLVSFGHKPVVTHAQDVECSPALSGETAQDYLARGLQFAGELHDTPCAVADLSKAIELDGGLLEAYLARARVYVETEAYDLALSDLNAVIERDPTNQTALIMRGRVYAGPNIVDSLGGPFLNLYMGYLGYGDDYLAALNDLDQAVAMNPDNIEAILAYGDFYGVNDDYESAVGQYSLAIDLYPDDPRGYYYRAFAQLRIDEAASSDRVLTSAVVEDLQQVVALAPDTPLGIYANASLLENVGQFEDALAEFQRGQQLYPNYAPIYYRFAYAVASMVFQVFPLPPGTTDQALVAIAHALELAPYSHLYRMRQGFLATTMGIDFALALENFTAVLEANPEFPPALLNLSGLYTFSQRYQDCTLAGDYLNEVLFMYDPDRIREVQEFRDFEATYGQRCIQTEGPAMVDVSGVYAEGATYTLGLRPVMLENVPGNPTEMVVCSPGSESTVMRTAQNPESGLTYVYLQCDGGEGWILESLLR
jgi:tetratricopeptide (TPR) repeat protein